MFAARCEHVATVIAPALVRGAWVISDRFTDATRAYQGGGRGVAQDKIDVLANWVHADTNPDVTFLFDLPREIAEQRLAGSRNLDRFERERTEFHVRVRDEYLRLAMANPARFRVIDASLSQNSIKVLIEQVTLTI